MSTFLKKITARKIRHLRDLNISLSDEQRRHLIITGKNGSGKTSLLVEMDLFLNALQSNGFNLLKSQQAAFTSQRNLLKESPKHPQRSQIEHSLKLYKSQISKYGKSNLEFSNDDDVGKKIQSGEFLVSFFDAKRQSQVNVPKGIQKVDLRTKAPTTSRENAKFLQYIVNAKVDRSFARDEGQSQEAQRIDDWFEMLTNQFSAIFDEPDLELVFDRKNYTFQIEIPNREAVTFNTLSDGFSAVLSIVTDLIIRMEAHSTQRTLYDMEGLVLIDEIETHLHVDLQKMVLPMLCSFFPKIQFVVTTHSPFVVSSIQNAVICDLEKQLITNDLSAYSYDTLIESFFGVDKYSEEVKLKLKEYEHLKTTTNKLSQEDANKLYDLEVYFAEAPKYLADELAVKLQQIKLMTFNGQKKND